MSFVWYSYMTHPHEEHYQMLFENAPISLWEEDYSEIKNMLDALRAEGITDLDQYMGKNPAFVLACMQNMRVVDVNQRTIEMFKAATKEELLENLDDVFRDGMAHHFRDELLALWNGGTAWAGVGVNYALDGTPIDILLSWRILPGYEVAWDKVLISIEDITERKRAEKRQQNLFEASPISLWEEDYTEIKKIFDRLRAEGVEDLQEYFIEHPEIVTQCMSLIHVRNVNQKTVELFEADSKAHLLANLDQVFKGQMEDHFARELIDLWNGKLSYDREGINYSLTGKPIHIHLHFRIMPGHEGDFGWAMVAIQDISARKKAEEYLVYLGTHDVMTGLYNRAYYQDELAALKKQAIQPTSILIADLNGLKQINDTYGHQAGDSLIRRTAEVLKATTDDGWTAARIGGDEFVILMPGVDGSKAEEVRKRTQALIEMNNKFYREPELSLSIGCAMHQDGETLDNTLRRADEDMYARKTEYYQTQGKSRR